MWIKNERILLTMNSVKYRWKCKVLYDSEATEDLKKEELQHPVQKFITSAETSLDPAARYKEIRSVKINKMKQTDAQHESISTVCLIERVLNSFMLPVTWILTLKQ